MTFKETKMMCILVLCTLFTMSMPLVFRQYRQNKFERDISQWTFKQSSHEVTAEDFAKMYVKSNMEISGFYSNNLIDNLNIEKSQISSILNAIFTDKDILECSEQMMGWSILHQESKGFIQIINHQPVVFNIVLITLGNSNGEYLEIGFEQRTSTLIYLSVQKKHDNYDNVYHLSLISNGISKYCESLGLISKNYECNKFYTDDDYMIFNFYIIPSSSMNLEKYIN